MRRILNVALLLLTAALGWSQEAPPKDTEAIIEVKYLDANRLRDLLNGIFAGSLRADPSLHAIAVRGTPDAVAGIVAAVKKLDVPPVASNIELTVYLVSGSTQAQGTDEVPQDLAATVKQLHALFPYKAYKLADSFVLRSRSSVNFGPVAAQTEGTLPRATNLDNLRYYFGYRSATVSGEPPRVVHLDGLRLDIRTPPITTPDNKVRYDTLASIATELDIREGQKTVVGKSSVNSAGDALILVIVPKVTD